MKQSEQQLVKAIGVMQYLVNNLDDILQDPVLKYIIRHDVKSKGKNFHEALIKQLNAIYRDADIEVHEQAQGIYNLIDNMLLIEE